MLKESIEKQQTKVDREVDIHTQLQKFDTLDMKAQLNLIVNSFLRNDRVFLEDWIENLLINKDYKGIEVGLNDIKITYKNAMVRIPIHSINIPIVINTKKSIPVWQPINPMNEGYKKEMINLLEEEKQNLKVFRKLNKIRKKYDKIIFSDLFGKSIFHTRKKKLKYLKRELLVFEHSLAEERLRYERMEQEINTNIQIEKERIEFLTSMVKDHDNWEKLGLKVVVQKTL